MPEYGPFESEREAFATQAYAALRAIDDTDPDPRAFPVACLKLITDACEATGVELGAYDLDWLGWLTGWEIAYALSLAGIIRRAAQPPEGTVTEWGVRRNLDWAIRRNPVDEVERYKSEAAARIASPGALAVVSRHVTPWTEAPETAKEE